jgi:dihydrofolate reductase
VIGGALVYAAALPLATRLFLTRIDRDVEGDAFFPAFDEASFRVASRRRGDAADVEFIEMVRP